MGERVVRLLDAAALDDYLALEQSLLGAELASPSGGLLIRTWRLREVPSSVAPGRWVAALEHERIPVVSYPHEWTFGMLRDAALLHLELLAAGLEDGLVTKDGTPYNIQFRGSRPVFIDVGSFERYRAGEPWYGYRQFCSQFLNPLLLQAATGAAFQPWLRGSVEGISPSDAARLLPRSTRLRPSVFPHVTVHAWAERRYTRPRRRQRDTGEVRSELRAAGMGRAVVRAQIRRLTRLVQRLRWSECTSADTAWSTYVDRHHYTASDLSAKEMFVRSVAAQRRRRQTLDLGANDGRFAKLVLDHTDYAVAVDADPVVVDRLYRQLRSDGEERVLPLCLDIADLSGGSGWAGHQRRSFLERVAPDLVLCLALVHHLAISRSIPFEAIANMIAGLRAETVIEVPRLSDPMVQRLLGHKASRRFPYSEETFLGALDRVLDVVATQELPSGNRVLYHARPRR